MRAEIKASELRMIGWIVVTAPAGATLIIAATSAIVVVATRLTS